MNNQKTYLINEDTRKAILDYLLSRPMKEVENGVNALRGLEEALIRAEPEESKRPEVTTAKET